MANIPFLNNAYFSAKVGIGTDSPDADFVVSHQGTSGIEIEANFQMGVNNILSFDRTAGALAYETMRLSANDFWFTALGVERMRITSTGNVGIGTNSPAKKLEIATPVSSISGSSTDEGAVLRLSSFINYENGYSGEAFIGGLEFYTGDSSGSGPQVFGAIKQRQLTYYNTQAMCFFTAPYNGSLTERMRIGSDGAIKFNTYGAGTLVSDASGNITVSSGGGAGGPYLPLAGGTMTGPINMGDFDITDIDELKFSSGTKLGDVGGSNYVRITYNSTGAGGLQIVDNQGQLQGYLYADGAATSSFGLLDGTGAWAVRCVENLYVELRYDNSIKLTTASTGITVTGDIQIDSALLSNQENTDVDTGAEVVAQVAIATYTAAFFDFVIKKGTNVRSGTVYACHDGTNVEFTETSTNDLGDTSDVTLSVDISGANMRLLATVTSDDWSVKSLIRAI